MVSASDLATSLAHRFRAEMAVSTHYSYFDHAAVAPLPSPTRAAISRWLAEAAEQGDRVWPQWSERVESLRQGAADLIGASTAEISLVPNTTTGISLVAEGWPWQTGDNVVTLANEFPSNVYPWMNLASRGVEARLVPVDDGKVDLQRLDDACDARTRIVSVSWVGYASGWRLDLDEVSQLCRRRGVKLFVDAIQGLGVFPVDVAQTHIDFLAADGHKWLLGPEGAGLLYVRQEHLDRLRPTNVGWHSVEPGGDIGRIEMNLRPTAARFEAGTQNMAGMIGLGASVDFLKEMGLSRSQSPIADHLLTATDYLCQRLSDTGATPLSPREGNHRSGIVTFQPASQLPLTQIRKRLLEAGVVTSVRGGGIRAAPHGYVIADDIERLIAVLVECRSAA